MQRKAKDSRTDSVNNLLRRIRFAKEELKARRSKYMYIVKQDGELCNYYDPIANLPPLDRGEIVVYMRIRRK